MALHAVGRARIERGIGELATFTHGNVRGRWHDRPTDIWRGQLPRDIDLPDYGPIYVITSYLTPIAWCVIDPRNDMPTWTMPTVRYSATTTNHQSVTALAVSQLYTYVNR